MEIDKQWASEFVIITKQIFYSFISLFEEGNYIKGGGEIELKLANHLKYLSKSKNSNFSKAILQNFKLIAKSLAEIPLLLLPSSSHSLSFPLIDCFRSKQRGFFFFHHKIKLINFYFIKIYK